MYLKIGKIKQLEKSWGITTLLTHIGLYKDDGTFVKWIKHDQIIIEKLQNEKIEITIPELEGLLKDHEIDKLIPSTIFNHIEFKNE